MRVRVLYYNTPFVVGLLVTASWVSILAVESIAKDNRSELVSEPPVSAVRDTAQVRLVHVADSKPVPDVLILESKAADMGPAGMPAMPAPVRSRPAVDDIYSFEADRGMAGPWALDLAAEVQREPETVRGTITADLVK